MNERENLMKPLPKLTAGDMLLSEPFMDDPNFKRSVVLLCEHKTEGSLGFIVNKALDMKLSDAVPELEEFDCQLYFGGPVETDTLHFIHTLGNQVEGSVQLTKNVYWGGNFEMLSIMIQTNQISPEQIRFFLGYSGWSPGQLKDEMSEQAWFLHSGKPQYLFNQQEQLWRSIMQEKGGKYKIMANYPEDPRLN